MSISKYQVFCAIVDHGSLTKAAEILKLTQSGVSHAISSLESEFGFSLLTRDRSGVSLTSNGERVLKIIREILLWQERMNQEISAINGLETGTVRIGTFTSVSSQWLPGIIKKFQTLYPAIEIKLLEGYYDDIEEWISRGTVDFGFVSLPTTKAFEFIALKKDKMLCILPEDHPLGGQAHITFDQMKEEAFIMPKWGSDDDVRRILNRSRVKLQIKYEVAEDQAIVAMVQNGLGISILPEMVLYRLSQDIRTLPLEQPHYRTIGIAANALNHISPASKKFIEYVKVWLAEQNLLDFKTK